MSSSRRSFLSIAASLLAAPLLAADEAKPIHSFASTFNELPVKNTKVGRSRAIVDGKSATTGYEFEAHQTTLNPGQMPHPPHRHAHDELFLVRRGTVEFTINGKRHRLGPGSVALASNNDEHGVKNVGTEIAQYFVVAIGRG